MRRQADQELVQMEEGDRECVLEEVVGDVLVRAEGASFLGLASD